MKKLPALALSLLLLLTGCQDTGPSAGPPSPSGPDSSSPLSGEDPSSPAGGLPDRVESRPPAESAPPGSTDASSPASREGEPSVVYNSVKVEKGGRFTGIQDSRTNCTASKITGFERGMLAYDRDGNPLELDWASMDSSSPASYSFLYDWDSGKLSPGETDDGGFWTLNAMGTDPAADETAYVLYCDKSLSFEGGAVWTNPDYDAWLEDYAGKPVPVDTLKNYYPHVQTIRF